MLWSVGLIVIVDITYLKNDVSKIVLCVPMWFVGSLGVYFFRRRHFQVRWVVMRSSETPTRAENLVPLQSAVTRPSYFCA